MKQRTITQNAALHKYFELIAEAMREAGIDLKEALPKVDIPASKESVKEVIWRPIQFAWTNKTSTADLTTKELNEVQDIVNRFISELGLEVMFPSFEEQAWEDLLKK